MDPATPINIAKGVVLTSIVTGTVAVAHGLYRGSRHPAPLAFSAAVNGGIAGAMFFGIREVLVGPCLRTTLHSNGPVEAVADTQPSWSHMRMYNVPDSAISGALTGAIIKSWQSGRASLWAGARTAGLVCVGLQLGFNELSIMRVKFVSRKLREDASPVLPPLRKSPEKPQLSWFDRFVGILGFRKLSDEDYLRVLKKQRDEALERIAILEQERMEKEQPPMEAE